MDKALRVFRNSQVIELIEASSIDSDSFKDLLCRCLSCNEFVDFVAANPEEAKRPRKSHFKHRRQVDPKMALACEQRVNSMSQQVLKTHYQKAAYLRQKWLRDEFWKLFKTHYESVNFPISNILAAITPFHRQVAQQMVSNWFDAKKKNSQLAQQVSAEASRTLSMIFQGESVFFDAGLDTAMFPRALQAKFKEKFLSQLNQKLQEAIVADVIEFLYQPRSRAIVQSLFEVAFYCITDCLVDGGDIGLQPQGYSWQVITESGRKGFHPGFWNYSDFNKNLCYQYASDHLVLWVCLIPYPLLLYI